jgi:hypothetical protein
VASHPGAWRHIQARGLCQSCWQHHRHEYTPAFLRREWTTTAEGKGHYRRACEVNGVPSLVDVRWDQVHDEVMYQRGWPLARTHREADVLDAVRGGRHRVEEIAKVIYGHCIPAHPNHLRAVLRRLFEREVLARRRAGKYWVYTLAVRKKEVG